jgi:hypothetical protein
MIQLPAAAISAKYEVGDGGRVSLSIYVAAQGARNGGRAFLKELAGDPLAPTWSPASETLRSGPDVAEATEQRHLMAMTKLTLLEIARTAKVDQPGTVFSIVPSVVGGRPEFIALVLGPNSQVATLAYDVKTGRRLR